MCLLNTEKVFCVVLGDVKLTLGTWKHILTMYFTLHYKLQTRSILFAWCLLCSLFSLIVPRPKGLRDDLVFLLEEDLSHINLCSLHCEMCNTEQLLGSLGLSAYRVGCLHLLNAALSSYGAESQQDFSRIKVKKKPGQQTGIERANIKVASFSGEFCSGIDVHIN